MLCKKGDKTDIGNYSLISVLKSFYKLHAAVIQRLEERLQRTQYGFRRGKGTMDAVSYARRVINKGEATRRDTILVLLD